MTTTRNVTLCAGADTDPHALVDLLRLLPQDLHIFVMLTPALAGQVQRSLGESRNNVRFWQPGREELDDRSLAWRLVVEEDANTPNIVLAVGLSIALSFTGNAAICDRLWVFLDEAEAEASDRASEKRMHRVLSAARRVIVSNPAAWERLSELTSFETAKAVVASRDEVPAGSVPSHRGALLPTVAHLLSEIRAVHRVLMYRDTSLRDVSPAAIGLVKSALAVAGEDVHVILVISEPDMSTHFHRDLSGNEHISVVLADAKPHQVEDGKLTARYAAWHVSHLAQLFGSAAILTDVSTAIYGLSNAEFNSRSFIVADADGHEKMIDLPRDTLENLSSTAKRLLFNDEDSRSLLESVVPAATSKTNRITGLFSADLSVEAARVLSHRFRDELSRSLPNQSQGGVPGERKRVLLAGHDFKFAGELLEHLHSRGDVELKVDKWAYQTAVDDARSADLLEWADVIICEFASHNAVWYSWAKREGQTLIVRFHGYELFADWIRDLHVGNVDSFVFVSDFYREKVVSELGWPISKTRVIPNMVDVADFERNKLPEARFHIGIAGIVPTLKRLDRALDLLEQLILEDSRYVLHIRGRFPWEYGWIWSNADSRDAYEAVYERLIFAPHLQRHVAFEPFGPDMARWFRKIGWTLSPSTRETFHLAPVEGMASGSVPVVWEREGATEIFGGEWVHADTRDAAKFILRTNASWDEYDQVSRQARDRAQRFDVQTVVRQWIDLISAVEAATTAEAPADADLARAQAAFEAAPRASTLSRLVKILVREGAESEAVELVESHSGLQSLIPTQQLTELRMKSAISRIKDGYPSIPPKAQGAVYLPVYGLDLHVVSPYEPGESNSPGAPLLGAPDRTAVRLMIEPPDFVPPTGVFVTDVRTDSRLHGVTEVSLPLANIEGLSVDRYLLVATDAIVREARALRPERLVCEGDFWVAFPALIASRRLGIPVLCNGVERYANFADADLTEMLHAEVDTCVSSGAPERDVQSSSAAFASPEVAKQPTLNDLKIGIIADEFTSRTVSQSLTVIPLSRNNGYVEIAMHDFDAIFIESAWEGPDHEWRRGIAYYKDEHSDLDRILAVARQRGIPVLFWNKEDPVHFRAFAQTAAKTEHVFTTDADMVGCYLAQSSDTLTASSIPFYAEPVIHNPLPTEMAYSHTVSYAGTYYGDRFRERSLELEAILEAASEHGVVIYDRQVNVKNSPYKFPPHLASYVREGVPYDEVLKVYKAHPVNINVNSASLSPTMFSRRVVEIAASGSLVMSGKGRGINEQLQTIEASDAADRWRALLDRWMTDERARIEDVWAQMRTVTRSHLASHALTLMLRTAGIPVRASSLPQYTLFTHRLSKVEAEAIVRQTWLPAAVFVVASNEEAERTLVERGVSVIRLEEVSEFSHCLVTEWFGPLESMASDTYYEDLLHATRFGSWLRIAAVDVGMQPPVGVPLVTLADVSESTAGLFHESLRGSANDLERLKAAAGERSLVWRMVFS